jgi:hypothetical protein
MPLFMQEAGSYRPAVRPERRRQMIEEMVAASPTVFNVLTTILQQRSGMLPIPSCRPHVWD